MKLIVVHDNQGNIVSAAPAQSKEDRASGPAALEGQHLAEVELTAHEAATPLDKLVARTRITGRGRSARLTARA